jgi:hypothetical protein
MRRIERRIEGLTAQDIALVQRVRRGGSVAPDEWLRFASGVEDLDGWLEDDADDAELEEDLLPVPCDGSVCCPCGDHAAPTRRGRAVSSGDGRPHE